MRPYSGEAVGKSGLPSHSLFFFSRDEISMFEASGRSFRAERWRTVPFSFDFTN